MDWHVVDENILEAHADLVPVGSVVDQTTQDQRIAQDYFNSIVIKHLFPDGDDVADSVRVRIPSRPQWVGHDAGSFPGCDEKKAVAEVKLFSDRDFSLQAGPSHCWASSTPGGSSALERGS